MKFTFDLFNGKQSPSQNFKEWIPGWWYYSEGIPLQRGTMPNGDEWLSAGFFLTEERIDSLIHKMRAEGIESLFKADGQFLLSLYSKEQNKVHIFRDRTGILPVIYAKGEKGLAISIWTGNVITLSGIKASPSQTIFEQFPLYRIKIAPDTPIEAIKSLSARCSLIISNETISLNEHPMTFPEGKPFTTLHSASSCLGEILSHAVKKRVANCKTVGTLLSGGNDSSLLVALAREHHSGDIKTVFVTFEDYQRNYGKYARQVANKFHTQHSELNVTARDYLNLWADTISIIQDPINSPGTIGQVAALKELSLSADVMLIGEGADTIFGGPYWAPMLLLSCFGSILPPFIRRPIKNMSSIIKGNSFLSRSLEKSLKALGTPLSKYIHSEIAFGDEKLIDLIFGSDIWHKSEEKFLKQISGDMFDSLFLYLMLDWLPFYNAALKRLGFYFGLIYVFPFLDYELMQNSLRLPKHLRYHYSTKKAALKKYAQKYFDKQFINKPKEGFGVPLSKWFAKPEFAPFLGLPLEERSLRRGWWNEKELKQIIELHRAGKGTDKSAESIPWITINLELWARICLEGDSPDLYKIS